MTNERKTGFVVAGNMSSRGVNYKYNYEPDQLVIFAEDHPDIPPFCGEYTIVKDISADLPREFAEGILEMISGRWKGVQLIVDGGVYRMHISDQQDLARVSINDYLLWCNEATVAIAQRTILLMHYQHRTILPNLSVRVVVEERGLFSDHLCCLVLDGIKLRCDIEDQSIRMDTPEYYFIAEEC